MDIKYIKQLHKKLVDAKRRESYLRQRLEEELLEYSDIEFFLEYHQNEGYLVMIEIEDDRMDIGEPLTYVIERLAKRGFLHKEEFSPIG